MSPAEARAYYRDHFAEWDGEAWIGHGGRMEPSFTHWVPGLEPIPACCPIHEDGSPAGKNGVIGWVPRLPFPFEP